MSKISIHIILKMYQTLEIKRLKLQKQNNNIFLLHCNQEK